MLRNSRGKFLPPSWDFLTFLTATMLLLTGERALPAPQDEVQRPCVPIHFHSGGADGSREEKELCVTEGTIKEIKEWGGVKKKFLITDAPQTRAVLSHDDLSSIGLCFSGLEEAGAIGTSDVSRQIGLKLKAQDTCNVVYVMWRFYPKSTLVISRKLNLDQHTHKECKNGGYKTLANLPLELPTTDNGFHSIKAQLNGNELVVIADEKKVWQGTLEDELGRLHGPMGLRTDKGTFLFQMDDWNSTKKNCPLTLLKRRPIPSEEHR